MVLNMLGLQVLLVFALYLESTNGKVSENCGITKPFQKIEVLADLAEKDECTYYAEGYIRTKIEEEVLACKFQIG